MVLRSRSFVVVLLVAALSSGCGGAGPQSQVEGRWDGPGRAALDVASDGTASGSDGCNQVAVDWASTSDTAGRFFVGGSTDMACLAVVGWDDAATYELSEDRLLIMDRDGDVLTEMTRVE